MKAYTTAQIRTKTLDVLVLFYFNTNTIVMRLIEFFAGCQVITSTFEDKGWECFSLDELQVRDKRKVNFLEDFMCFDYKQFNPDDIDVLWFGFPCTTFSKASGGKHFLRHAFPLTDKAKESLLMLERMFEIIDYFSNAIFYIENPSGGLCNNIHFLEKFKHYQAYIYRLEQGSFGYYTQKQTDIFTNSSVLLITNPVTRTRGRYQKIKFDNLTLVKRQAYTSSFAEFIYENAIRNFC